MNQSFIGNCHVIVLNEDNQAWKFNALGQIETAIDYSDITGLDNPTLTRSYQTDFKISANFDRIQNLKAIRPAPNWLTYNIALENEVAELKANVAQLERKLQASIREAEELEKQLKQIKDVFKFDENVDYYD